MTSVSRRSLSAIALIVAFGTLDAMMEAHAGRQSAPLKVEGCSLLRYPAKFNNRLIEVSGRAYGAFESWSISFDCPGYLNLSQSLSEPDIRKYGFKTSQDEKMQQFSHMLFPNSDLMAREAHHARVTLIGRFLCHYDFPNCQNISSHGDSSIVIRSVSSVSPDDNTSQTRE